MEKQDYTQELFSDYFKKHVIAYALTNGDVIISDNKDVFEALVLNYKNKGYEVEIGNLVETGISGFARKGELHDDLVHAIAVKQQLYGQSSNTSKTETYVASKNVDNIKDAVSIVIDRYAASAGKAFSRSEVSVVSGTLEINTSINNQKLKQIKLYSDAEANSKEEKILKLIDAAAESADEM